MPIFFKLTPRPVQNVEPADPRHLGGADIALPRGVREVTAHGDWALVRNRDAGVQSVIREANANPGSLVFRPQWGWGLPALLFKGVTPATLDRAQSNARRRLIANGRVTKTMGVQASAIETDDNHTGMTLDIQVSVRGARDPENITIKPNR